MARNLSLNTLILKQEVKNAITVSFVIVSKQNKLGI